MTTRLPIPSGPTNKEIIDRAFQAMGTSSAMFGRSEDEYAEAMLALNAMMEEWPFNLTGFIIEDAAGLRIEEESGIARKHLNAVAYSLAESMAPTFGKPLAPEARKIKNRSYSRLCSDVAVIPQAQFPAGTARGSHRSPVYFAEPE